MFWKTMVRFMLVLMLALSGTMAVEAAEDCVPFNPNNTTVSFDNNNWKIVDGSHALFSFGANQAEAREALAIIKNFKMNQSCFVGRPQPSFAYMLVSGRAPSGSMAGEHCVPFNPASATVAFVKNDWKIVDGDHWLLSFGPNQAEAREALAIIKKYNFNSSCSVGKPNPSFTYMKASGSAPISAVTGTAPVTGTLAPNQPVQGTVAPAAADLKADRIW
ncbi:hypothetical protein EG834_21755, partial [bacterium]|nr:hypothetical protein [bacterium]